MEEGGLHQAAAEGAELLREEAASAYLLAVVEVAFQATVAQTKAVVEEAVAIRRAPPLGNRHPEGNSCNREHQTTKTPP